MGPTAEGGVAPEEREKALSDTGEGTVVEAEISPASRWNKWVSADQVGGDVRGTVWEEQWEMSKGIARQQ